MDHDIEACKSLVHVIRMCCVELWYYGIKCTIIFDNVVPQLCKLSLPTWAIKFSGILSIKNILPQSHNQHLLLDAKILII